MIALVLAAAAVLSGPMAPPTECPVLECQRVSSPFGYRRSDHRFHPGTDFPAPMRTPVRATADGKVVWADFAGDYGLLVIVDHGSGVRTWYAHLSRAIYRVGTPVTAGQVIANVGSTGYATGPHLHYEIRVHGAAQDPMKSIQEVHE